MWVEMRKYVSPALHVIATRSLKYNLLYPKKDSEKMLGAIYNRTTD